MKKVIVACGGAVATSTMAAEEIKELCEENNSGYRNCSMPR